MTQFEIVVPTEWGKDVFETLCSIVSEKASKWAWALHEVDERSSFQHWHIGCTLPSSRTVDDVVGWFAGVERIKGNSIERIKKHWKTYICYILHRTKEAIAQGKTLASEYGGNADFDGALRDYQTKGECDTLIADILSGKVLEYQFHANTELVAKIIEKGWYNKVKQAFESADKNRLNESTSLSSERKQCWIFGKAGSGKTELAKWYCRSCGYGDMDIYITSSGQNPFDDYKGQPCVIVDDIDADTMSPKTALKLADCFTGSAVKARYSNKVIFAKLVIFTSTVAPQNWWRALANDKVDGNVYQLLRRLNLGSWHIVDDGIEVTVYDGQGEIAGNMKLAMPAEIMQKVNSMRKERVESELVTTFGLYASDVKGNKLQMTVDASARSFSGTYTVADDSGSDIGDGDGDDDSHQVSLDEVLSSFDKK